MYNLEEMYVDILDTITKNVQSRRDACRYTAHNNENVQSRRDVCRYTGHNNDKCTI